MAGNVKIPFALPLLLLAISLVWSAGVRPAIATGASEYLVDGWDVSSGLPDSTVTAIAQTPDGYIWVGTENGLARFDGVRFVTFNRDNTPVLENPGMESLCLDQPGRLWIGGKGQLVVWNGEKFAATGCPLAATDKIEKMLASNSNQVSFATSQGCVLQGRMRAGDKWEWTALFTPAEDSQFATDAGGRIWRLTGAGELACLEGGVGKAVTLTRNDDPPMKLVADSAGRVWVATEKGLYYADGGDFQMMAPPAGTSQWVVTEMVGAGDGGLWVVAGGKLWKLQNLQWGREAGAWPEHDSPTRPLLEDRTGRLWFGQWGGGLIRVDPEGKLLTLTTQDGLPGDRVRCLFQDQEGNLWAGIDRGGLVRLREKRFQVLGTADGLAAPVVLSVCEDAEGTVWAGTYGGGLSRWSKGKFSTYNFGRDGSKGDVFSVLPDRQGRIWIGTGDNGVFMLSEGEFQRPFPANAMPGQVRAIFEDHRGTIWFGTTAGLYFWSWQEGALRHFDTDPELAQASVGCMAEDTAGVLWVGTHGQGLQRIEGGRGTSFQVANGLPNEFVHALLADASGTVWVGMYGGGLLRCKQNHLAICAPRNNLPDDVICHVADDNKGWLWISSRRGLFRVAKADLNAYADGQRKTVTFIAYGKFDGLPTVEFTGGQQPTGWNGLGDRLWFATVKGLVSLQPNLGTLNTWPPPVVIESLLVDDELFAGPAGSARRLKPAARPLQIPAGKNRIEFQFAGLSFTAPDKVRFQYWLKGLENDWVDGGMSRSATYSYLPPGNYEFHVRAANNDGVWNNTGAVVAFEVLPQFWQRWWFRLLAVALVAALAGVLHHLRVSRLRELQRLRLRIARDLHDDVGTNLASVAVMAEVMKTNPSANDAMVMRQLALRTIDSLRDIVWFVDPACETLGDLVSRMKETGDALLPNLEVAFDASVPNPGVVLAPKFRRNIFPIFKEALHNTAAHAQASRVGITLQCEDGWFYLKIEDNGTGFVEGEVALGNGLRNLRTRALEMNGTIQILGRPGRGTLVEMRAPLTRRGWNSNLDH